jgi:hypothetical protein
MDNLFPLIPINIDKINDTTLDPIKNNNVIFTFVELFIIL